MKKPIKAILCDLDGVLTQTAKLHGKAWKQMFDSFLLERANWEGSVFREFTIEGDYPNYVDGKPRLEGIIICRGVYSDDGAI